MVRVRVNLVRQGKVVELEMPEGSKVRDLIKRLGFSTQGVVVTKDSVPLLEDEALTPGEFTVFQVASGG
ncbi:MAG: thiamine biosynthesis protein ThiS [Thermoprotei archaeon]